MKYRFSVVIPVYNVEAYVGEAIESIIAQSVGFKEHIQIILVNDGSRDRSGDVCARYRDAYPDNIVYIEQENKGVSSARNKGLRYACGQYINFLDADDLWEENAFHAVQEFFSDNPHIKLVTCRMIMFGRRNKVMHHLDYEYGTTRTIDINETYDYPQISVARAFFSRDCLEGHFFDEEVAVSEDMLFINKIIMETRQFGVVREAVYRYRKRYDNTSALDTSAARKGFYTITPAKVYLELINCSLRDHNCVLPFIQYLLITDLQFRLKAPVPEGLLSSSEKAYYLHNIRTILSYIEDQYILKQRHMRGWQKAYALIAKNGKEIFDRDAETKLEIIKEIRFNIDLLSVEDRYIYITGRSEEKSIDENYRLTVLNEKGEAAEVEYGRYSAFDTVGLFDEINIPGYIYFVKLPLSKGSEYRFVINRNDKLEAPIKIRIGNYSRLSRARTSYISENGYIIKRAGDSVCIRKNTNKEHLLNELKHIKLIYQKREYDALRRRMKMIIAVSKSKSRWIICGGSEENLAAEFCRFLTDNKKKKVSYLIDDMTSEPHFPDCNENIVWCGTDEHCKSLAEASLVISFGLEDRYYRPAGNEIIYYSDLISYRHVFVSDNIEEAIEANQHRIDYNISSILTHLHEGGVKETEKWCEGLYELIMNSEVK